jgi:hypothetical protein
MNNNDFKNKKTNPQQNQSDSKENNFFDQLQKKEKKNGNQAKGEGLRKIAISIASIVTLSYVGMIIKYNVSIGKCINKINAANDLFMELKSGGRKGNELYTEQWLQLSEDSHKLCDSFNPESVINHPDFHRYE